MTLKGSRAVAPLSQTCHLHEEIVSAVVMLTILASLPGSAYAAINFTNTDQVLGDSASYTADIDMADLDGDGDQDIYEAMSQTSGYEPAPDRVWLNDGTGSFYDSGQQLGPEWDSAVVLADMDGDGDADAVIAAAASSPSINVYFNDGQGQFDYSAFPMDGEHVLAIAVGDVDGDGDMDVVCGNNVTVTVLLNDGTGQLSDSGQQLGDSYSNSVTLADVDGDGDLDIVNGTDSVYNNYVTPALNTIWLNNGSGQYTLSVSNIGDKDVSDILFGDLDGDGDLDAFSATNDGVNHGEVWSNDGSGRFVVTGTVISGQSDSSPISASALSDVDDDGDLDIVIFGSEFRIYENQGGMSFQAVQVIDSSNTSNSIVMVDVDGDADPDLVSGSKYASDEVYLNEPATDNTTNTDTPPSTDTTPTTSSDTTSSSSGGGGGGSMGAITLLLAFLSLLVMGLTGSEAPRGLRNKRVGSRRLRSISR